MIFLYNEITNFYIQYSEMRFYIGKDDNEEIKQDSPEVGWEDSKSDDLIYSEIYSPAKYGLNF